MIDVKNCLRFTALEDGCTVYLDDSATKILQYSTDGVKWNDFILGEKGKVTLAKANDYVLLIGEPEKFVGYGDKVFITEGALKVSGNIMSIYDGGECTATTITKERYFYNLFSECTIVDASELILPATTLSDNCYTGLFSFCTKLTKAPELPATTLSKGCYRSMFTGCKSLTTAPELPATTLTDKCYYNMFYHCDKLNEITVMFSDVIGEDALRTWVLNVAPTGTFYNLGGADLPVGVDGIPTGWEVKETKSVDVEIEVYNATTNIIGEKKVGSTIQITVNPFPGYRFIKWDDGNTDNPRTMILEGNVNLTAIVEERVMEKIQYRLQGESDFRDEPLTFNFDREGGGVDFDILYTTNQGVEYDTYCYFDWGTITDRGGTWISNTQRLESYTLTVPENDSLAARSGEVVVELPTVRGYIKVNQSYEWRTIPCWMDYYYEGGTETLDYYVEADGIGIIYYGRAYLQPGKRSIKINISKIVQDYLKNEIEDVEDILNPDYYLGSGDAVKLFYLYKNDGTLLKEYNYRYDWSYEMADLYDEVLTTPINGHRDPRMIALGTDLRDGEYYVTEWKNDLYTTGHCGNYALYYLQRNGGYAAFLIEGNATKTDSYQKYSYNMAFNNTKAEFEEKVYHSEISTTWEMSTGWLKDNEAENLAFNLLASNCVYLHDLRKNKLIPVLIANNNAEYKTFKNQGKKMVNFTITLTESQKKQNL